MAAKLNLLSDPECKNATSEGRAIRKLHDGGGLYLWVYADGSKFWRLRYWIDAKEKSLSFGAYPEIMLKVARVKRDAERKRLDENLDPSAERKAKKLKSKIASTNSFEAFREKLQAPLKAPPFAGFRFFCFLKYRIHLITVN